MKTILLLTGSNVFMTIAWYRHLKEPEKPIVWTILLCWLIALAEYALQVPANRLGKTEYRFTVTQLKVIQEVVSLSVFAVYALVYFGEVPGWRTLLAFALIVVACFLAMPNALGEKPVAPQG